MAKKRDNNMTSDNGFENVDGAIIDTATGSEYEPTADDMSENLDYLNAEGDFHQEPDVDTEIAEHDADNLDIDFNNALCLLSRCPGVEYEVAQYGDCVFTVERVIMHCYRLELPFSDDEIAKRLAKLVRQGQLERVGRGKFKAPDFAQVSYAQMKAELEAMRAARLNPQKR